MLLALVIVVALFIGFPALGIMLALVFAGVAFLVVLGLTGNFLVAMASIIIGGVLAMLFVRLARSFLPEKAIIAIAGVAGVIVAYHAFGRLDGFVLGVALGFFLTTFAEWAERSKQAEEVRKQAGERDSDRGW